MKKQPAKKSAKTAVKGYKKSTTASAQKDPVQNALNNCSFTSKKVELLPLSIADKLTLRPVGTNWPPKVRNALMAARDHTITKVLKEGTQHVTPLDQPNSVVHPEPEQQKSSLTTYELLSEVTPASVDDPLSPCQALEPEEKEVSILIDLDKSVEKLLHHPLLSWSQSIKIRHNHSHFPIITGAQTITVPLDCIQFNGDHFNLGHYLN